MMTPAKMRVLFVDDEPIILELIELTVASMKDEWATSFVRSAEEAMKLLESESFGLVVSDMHLPGMSGAQLLNEVMRRSPSTIRIVLSGGGDRELVMKCVGATHQFLLKPFKLPDLKAALKRINGLKERLHAPEIQKLVTRRQSLPSIPDVYFKIINALQKPDCPIEHIGEIVATDPALTVKLLQLVNSAFLGYAREVSSADEAVMLLGTGIIRSLALSMNLFSAFNAPLSANGSLNQVWSHCVRVARLARRLAQIETGDEKVMEESFTAGLLHDVGKLVLADNPAANYLQLLNQAHALGRPLIETEREAFQATHAEVGAYLLDLWGLPSPLVEAVAFHHEPARIAQQYFTPLTAVHTANVLEQEASNPTPGASSLDLAYLEQLHLTARIDVWRKQLDAL